MAEAPAGHMALSAVASHALWDAWVHERDICLPLGLPVDVEPDEVAVSLRYAAGLGPAFLATEGSARSGAFGVSVTHPDATSWSRWVPPSWCATPTPVRAWRHSRERRLP